MRFGPFEWDAEFEVADGVPRPSDRVAIGQRHTVRPGGGPRPRDCWSRVDQGLGADIRLRGVWRLLSPIVAMEAKSGPAREFQQLKARVEASPVMAATTATWSSMPGPGGASRCSIGAMSVTPVLQPFDRDGRHINGCCSPPSPISSPEQLALRLPRIRWRSGSSPATWPGLGRIGFTMCSARATQPS